ncbi:hypothetical protein LWI29_021782 [Acer saccharum]|uniref:Uncharacterized protein n=1 Tax=Acer saccharum TaxID=4024 RepID=A0AA39SRX1_ACESA|nr:hypothetical protein LWI29_021782 [Acer saccharum]
MMEVPSGILPCCIEEADKEEIYRLYMEDQKHNTPVMLAKAYGTSMETINVILFERDALNFSKKITLSRKLVMFKLYWEKPKIFMTVRLAKDYGVASPSVLMAMYQLVCNAAGSYVSVPTWILAVKLIGYLNSWSGGGGGSLIDGVCLDEDGCGVARTGNGGGDVDGVVVGKWRRTRSGPQTTIDLPSLFCFWFTRSIRKWMMP